jgi:phospholipid/cholesterol/gamma-HCH transport system substrate-binding protein
MKKTAAASVHPAMKLSIESKARLAFAAVILLGTAAALGGYLVTEGRYATYQVRTQDSVSGLIVDAPVEFHGVEVGRVKRVELTTPQSVSILLSVRKEAPVTSATVATITSRGLATRGFTGYVYVSLEDGDTQAQPLAAAPGEPFPLLRAGPSRSVNLDTAISQVNENVQAMTGLLQSVLDEKTVASLKQSADSLQQLTQTLAANNGRLAAIVANTEQASRQFRPLLQSGNDTVQALQMQVLPEAQNALVNLNHLSTSLNRAAAKIDRDPSVLIRGAAAPLGPGESR